MSAALIAAATAAVIRTRAGEAARLHAHAWSGQTIPGFSSKRRRL